MKGERLDLLLHRRGLAPSREKARRLILAGQVFVDGRRVDKAGAQVDPSADIVVRQGMPYVSRGGLKLEHALHAFGIDPRGLVAADVGASTGGFTDCLLQHGAERVYAIDVGYGQLDWGLRQDPRVVVMERTNARHLEALPEAVALVTIDVSFISLTRILPQVHRWLAPDGEVVALVKPQFEAGPERVGKGGVVRDRGVHRDVLQTTLTWAQGNGWRVLGVTRSPITGPKGNVEFLVWLRVEHEPTGNGARTDVDGLVDVAIALWDHDHGVGHDTVGVAEEEGLPAPERMGRATL
ncbi:MAG TPA: TlyA family RNA methyltransferase [Chloroflexi bacterium]|jgi:23S rRNA (cytidine1920-2'-O)/16S rRNA (cytidine1409-2'-O)-methyltransferase|nr:TlyA family RNA methyltransferase [Chloroflexota bacterium]